LVLIDFQEVFPKSYILPLVDRISSTIEESNTNKLSSVVTQREGYIKQILAISLIKLGKKLQEPDPVQKGKELLADLAFVLQYEAFLKLARYFSTDQSSKVTSHEWLDSAARILQHYIQNQPVTSFEIDSKSLVRTVLELNLLSRFDQDFALVKEYLLKMGVFHQPRNLLDLAGAVISKPELASNLVAEATSIAESDGFKRNLNLNRFTFEIEMLIASQKRDLSRIQELKEKALHPENYTWSAIHYQTTHNQTQAHPALQMYHALKGSELENEGEKVLSDSLKIIFSQFEKDIWSSKAEKSMYMNSVFNFIQKVPETLLPPYKDTILSIIDNPDDDKFLSRFLQFFPLTRALLKHKIGATTPEEFRDEIQEASEKYRQQFEPSMKKFNVTTIEDVLNERVKLIEQFKDQPEKIPFMLPPRCHPEDVNNLLAYSFANDHLFWKNTHYHEYLMSITRRTWDYWKKNDDKSNLRYVGDIRRVNLKNFFSIIDDERITGDKEFIKEVYRQLGSPVGKHLEQGTEQDFWTVYGEILYHRDFNDITTAHDLIIEKMDQLMPIMKPKPIPKKPKKQNIPHLMREKPDENKLYWDIYTLYLTLLIELDGQLKQKTHEKYLSVYPQTIGLTRFCPVLARNGFIDLAEKLLTKYYTDLPTTPLLKSSYESYYMLKTSILRKSGQISAARASMQKVLEHATGDIPGKQPNFVYINELLYLDMKEELQEALNSYIQEISKMFTSRISMGMGSHKLLNIEQQYKKTSPLFNKLPTNDVPKGAWSMGREILADGLSELMQSFFDKPSIVPNESSIFSLLAYLIALDQKETVKKSLDQLVASIEYFIKDQNLSEIEEKVSFLITSELPTIPPEELQRIISINPAVVLTSTMNPMDSIKDSVKWQQKKDTRIPGHLSRFYSRLSRLYKEIGEREMAVQCKKNGSQFTPVKESVSPPNIDAAHEQRKGIVRIRENLKEKRFQEAKKNIEILMGLLDPSKIKYVEQLEPYISLVALMADSWSRAKA
jgi:hypothetical protein